MDVECWSEREPSFGDVIHMQDSFQKLDLDVRRIRIKD